MAPISAADIYPAVRRFLLESGLQRALKAFDKETSSDESNGVSRGKKAKVLAELELTEACQLWLDGHRPAAATNSEGNTEEPKKKDKRKASTEVEAVAAAAEAEEGTLAERPKKKGRKDPEAEKAEQTQGEVDRAEDVAEEPKVEKKDKKKRGKAETQEEVAEAPKVEKKEKKDEAADEEVVKAHKGEKQEKTNEDAATQEEVAETSKIEKKEKKKERAAERQPGVPFKRIDDEKWKATIKDSRLMDNTHKAKDRFGQSAGDAWGDKAAEDLLKVKGKGFRKEMAKKKRASWRGGGQIDQGVNSIKFDDSSDEE